MSYDPPSYVINFAETRHCHSRWRSTTPAGRQAWGDVKLTPTTYLVDKGRIVKRLWASPTLMNCTS